jgi:hypothetical protein
VNGKAVKYKDDFGYSEGGIKPQTGLRLKSQDLWKNASFPAAESKKRCFSNVENLLEVNNIRVSEVTVRCS